jgi:hypothetical protein
MRRLSVRKRGRQGCRTREVREEPSPETTISRPCDSELPETKSLGKLTETFLNLVTSRPVRRLFIYRGVGPKHAGLSRLRWHRMAPILASAAECRPEKVQSPSRLDLRRAAPLSCSENCSSSEACSVGNGRRHFLPPWTHPRILIEIARRNRAEGHGGAGRGSNLATMLRTNLQLLVWRSRRGNVAGCPKLQNVVRAEIACPGPYPCSPETVSS